MQADPSDQIVQEWAKKQVFTLLDGLKFNIHANKPPLLFADGAVVTVDIFVPYPETRH